jgi:hypothetical protein
MFDRASPASAAPDPGRPSAASHSGPDIRSRAAALVKNTRCSDEILASSSDSRYSLTNWSLPPKEAAAPGSEPPSRRYSAARYSPTAHPSVRRCRPVNSSSPTGTCASRNSTAASSRVSAKSAGPIPTILPSARSRATRTGG